MQTAKTETTCYPANWRAKAYLQFVLAMLPGRQLRIDAYRLGLAHSGRRTKFDTGVGLFSSMSDLSYCPYSFDSPEASPIVDLA